MLTVPTYVEVNNRHRSPRLDWLSIFLTDNMDRLPLAATIILVSLLVTFMIVLVLGTVYTVYYS
jgi:hypothetical protein